MNSNEIQFLDPSRIWISIIGMGAGGANLFTSIVARAKIDPALSRSIGLLLFDTRPVTEFGKGVAWGSVQSELFLCNMQIHTMGLKAEIVQRINRQDGLIEPVDHDELPDRFLYHQRIKLGKIFHEDYIAHLKWAEDNDLSCKEMSASIDDIVRSGRGFAVCSRDHGHYFFDYVVLALGNVPSGILTYLSESPNYIHNPWDWDKYKVTMQDKDVGVVGLGPTAVDTILYANQCGAKSILAASRSGRIQYPRPKSEPYELKHMTEEKFAEYKEILVALGEQGITYDKMYFFLTLEFREGHACPDWKDLKSCIDKPVRDQLYHGAGKSNTKPSWFSILKAMDVHTPAIWNCLTPEAKEQYRKNLERDHMCISFGMAAPQALRLIGMIEDQKIRFGRLKTNVRILENGKFEIQTVDKRQEVDCIVNCCGIGRRISDFSEPLIPSLKTRGWISEHPEGGVIVDFKSGQVLRSDEGEPVGEIYALAGSLTRGTHLFTNGLAQLLTSCERTAQHILVKVASNLPRVI